MTRDSRSVWARRAIRLLLKRGVLKGLSIGYDDLKSSHQFRRECNGLIATVDGYGCESLMSAASWPWNGKQTSKIGEWEEIRHNKKEWAEAT